MKQILLLVSMIGMIAVVGCDDEVVIYERSSLIEGFVVDSISQLPIDSVALYLNDTNITSSFYSDTLGIFKYVIFGEGVHRVFFQKQGYFTLSQLFDFGTNPKDLKVELVKQ